MDEFDNFSDISELMTTYKAWKKEYYSVHTKCELLEKKVTFCENQIDSSKKENSYLLEDMKRLRSLMKLQQSNLKNLSYLQDENKTLSSKLKNKNEELVTAHTKLELVVRDYDKAIMDLKLKHEQNLKDLETTLQFEDKEQLDEMMNMVCLKEETIQSLENEIKEQKMKHDEETFRLKLEFENKKRGSLALDSDAELPQEGQVVKMKEFFKNKLANQRTEHNLKMSSLQKEITKLGEQLKKYEMGSCFGGKEVKPEEKIKNSSKKPRVKPLKQFSHQTKNLGPRGKSQSVTSSIIQFTRKRKLFKPENNFM